MPDDSDDDVQWLGSDGCIVSKKPTVPRAVVRVVSPVLLSDDDDVCILKVIERGSKETHQASSAVSEQTTIGAPEKASAFAQEIAGQADEKSSVLAERIAACVPENPSVIADEITSQAAEQLPVLSERSATLASEDPSLLTQQMGGRDSVALAEENGSKIPENSFVTAKGFSSQTAGNSSSGSPDQILRPGTEKDDGISVNNTANPLGEDIRKIVGVIKRKRKVSKPDCKPSTSKKQNCKPQTSVKKPLAKTKKVKDGPVSSGDDDLYYIPEHVMESLDELARARVETLVMMGKKVDQSYKDLMECDDETLLDDPNFWKTFDKRKSAIAKQSELILDELAKLTCTEADQEPEGEQERPFKFRGSGVRKLDVMLTHLVQKHLHKKATEVVEDEKDAPVDENDGAGDKLYDRVCKLIKHYKESRNLTQLKSEQSGKRIAIADIYEKLHNAVARHRIKSFNYTFSLKFLGPLDNVPLPDDNELNQKLKASEERFGISSVKDYVAEFEREKASQGVKVFWESGDEDEVASDDDEDQSVEEDDEMDVEETGDLSVTTTGEDLGNGQPALRLDESVSGTAERETKRKSPDQPDAIESPPKNSKLDASVGEVCDEPEQNDDDDDYPEDILAMLGFRKF